MTAGKPGEVRRRIVDVATAIPFLLVCLVGTHQAAAHQEGLIRDLDPLAYSLVVLAAASVALWRAVPLCALLSCGAVVASYLGAGYPWGPVVFPLVLVSVGAALRVAPERSLRPALGVLGLLVLGMGVRFAQDPEPGAAIAVVTGPGWLAVPFAIGTVIRMRHDTAARARREDAEKAVAAERLRIAAEVHDVAGHGLAVIAMQAGVALHVLERRPEQARIALQEIRAASTEALDGLRSTLAGLRTDEIPHSPGPPGLDDVDALVERIRRAGLSVELHRSGNPLLTGPQIGQAAYRIVQESLTNVLRHSHARTATVELRWTPAGLECVVRDDGIGGPVGPGTGIVGMRDRVLALGGALDAGPDTGGGFAVHARLPVHAP